MSGLLLRSALCAGLVLAALAVSGLAPPWIAPWVTASPAHPFQDIAP